LFTHGWIILNTQTIPTLNGTSARQVIDHEKFHILHHHFEWRCALLILAGALAWGLGAVWLLVMAPIYIGLCLFQELSAAFEEVRIKGDSHDEA
jgi:hypothetical protein